MQVTQGTRQPRAILAALATEGARQRAPSWWLGPAANRRERALFWGAIAAVDLLALSLRLPGLAPQSLYLDDAWVALLARDASLPDLLAIKPPHPVGFIALLAIARRLLPGAELSLQLLPLAASLALVPLGAWLVRRTTGGLAGGILAAVLLALNPTLSDYAVRAKPYATDALLALVLVAATGRCLAEPSQRHLGRLALLAAPAALFSYPAALVGVVGFAGALAAALAATRERGPLMRLAGAFLAAEVALGVLLVYGQANRALTSFWQGGFVPLQKPLDGIAFILSRSALILGSSFPHGWQALGILVLVGFVLLVRARETRFAAAFLLALWSSLFAAAAVRLYPVDGRTTAFAYPLVALVAAGAISALARRARRTFVREGVPALLAAAIVLSSATRVTYPLVEDARLVRALAAEAEPEDVVLIYPHTNWSAGYYSGWPVRLVPVDYYGARFEARLLRDRSVTLPGLAGYEDRPEVLDPALRDLVSLRPERVLYLATHLEVSCCAAHVHIGELLGASGYRPELLARAQGAELLRFTRHAPRPSAGAPPPLPQARGLRSGPLSSTPAGP
jgi:hypothetical protein